MGRVRGMLVRMSGDVEEVERLWVVLVMVVRLSRRLACREPRISLDIKLQFCG